MLRLTLLLALQALLACSPLAQPPLSLEVDGKQYGVFDRLSQDREGGGTVTLEQGWIDIAFLVLWGKEFGEGLAPGPHGFPADCAGRRLEVTQSLAPDDPRGRLRSWTLMGACPVACEVEAIEGEKVRVKSLTLKAQGVGVVR
jgi:hypothetical protein